MAVPDWSKLSFGLEHTGPYMFLAKWTAHSGWTAQGCVEYGNLSMPPSAQVLNYGQSLFEGMKALRTVDDRVVLFRPTENAERMNRGAVRMNMPQLPESLFLRAVAELVEKNAAYVPPHGKGSMYLRPLLLGTGPTLGLSSAPEFTFVVYSAAVGSYFGSGSPKPIHLKVEERYHRAAPRGVGDAKCAGNYAASLAALRAAKEAGFNDVVYLDAKTDSNLEELSAANIFVVKGKHIKTPALIGTILPGVTRKSILQLAEDAGYTVEETNVPVIEALKADEVFTTGTAVGVCPVGSLTYHETKTSFGTGDAPGPVCQALYDALIGTQSGDKKDKYGWVVPLKEMSALIQAASEQ